MLFAPLVLLSLLPLHVKPLLLHMRYDVSCFILHYCYIEKSEDTGSCNHLDDWVCLVLISPRLDVMLHTNTVLLLHNGSAGIFKKDLSQPGFELYACLREVFAGAGLPEDRAPT